jgi:hypothetical protein
MRGVEFLEPRFRENEFYATVFASAAGETL